MESDVTVAGSDQLFNELMGRHYQERFGATLQTLITTRITPGLDGGSKQSESLGDFVALLDGPTEKFGKLMSLLDTLVEVWASAYSDLAEEEIGRLAAGVLMRGARARDAKLELAEAIVRRYHGSETALRSRQAFISTFSEGNEPDQMPVITVQTSSVLPLDLVRLACPDLRNGAMHRLLVQRAVRLNGNVILEASRILLEGGAVLRTGPRGWWRIKMALELS